MMPGTLRVLLAFVVAAASLAQERPAFQSKVELVTIPCSVVDGRGVAVSGLTREEFRVFDNGTPRVVENLWVDSDLPLTLGVLIDASESQRGQLEEHRRTAHELLARILRPGDHAFVVSVGEDIRLEDTPGELLGEPCPKQRSNAPGVPAMSVCGSSPLWNAIHEAARIKLRPITGNKALLILTDGFDSGSTHTWREAVDEAHRADASVYAVQYRSGFGGKYAPDLYRLVAEAGGTWFEAPAEEYDAIVSRIETDLRRRYVLGFRPEKGSGRSRHEVRVEVTRPELSVRARKVYFREAE